LEKEINTGKTFPAGKGFRKTEHGNLQKICGSDGQKVENVVSVEEFACESCFCGDRATPNTWSALTSSLDSFKRNSTLSC
jgi:hypothetical protein